MKLCTNLYQTLHVHWAAGINDRPRESESSFNLKNPICEWIGYFRAFYNSDRTRILESCQGREEIWSLSCCLYLHHHHASAYVKSFTCTANYCTTHMAHVTEWYGGDEEGREGGGRIKIHNINLHHNPISFHLRLQFFIHHYDKVVILHLSIMCTVLSRCVEASYWFLLLISGYNNDLLFHDRKRTH